MLACLPPCIQDYKGVSTQCSMPLLLAHSTAWVASPLTPACQVQRVRPKQCHRHHRCSVLYPGHVLNRAGGGLGWVLAWREGGGQCVWRQWLHSAAAGSMAANRLRVPRRISPCCLPSLLLQVREWLNPADLQIVTKVRPCPACSMLCSCLLLPFSMRRCHHGTQWALVSAQQTPQSSMRHATPRPKRHKCV